MPASRRSSLAVVAVVAFAIVVTFAGLFGAGAFSVGGFGRTPSTEPAPTSPFSKYVASGDKVLSEALSAVHVRLPTRQGAPAPDLPARAFSGIRPHVVVGFLPSYELAKLKSAVLSDYSTIVFSSIGILGNGGLDHSSDGWLRLRQGEVAPLLSGAHRAGTEVLLGLSATSNSVIDALTASPVASAGRLLAAVSPLLAQGFDGVDLDVEGQSGAGRAGYSTFVSVFSKALHARKATWQLMVNTYPQSAVDSEGFYDVEALAPAVNEFFVMAYDMSDLAVPSATAPLTGADLSDVSVVSSYAAGGFAAKSILGVPFYGYDFPASRGHPPAVTAGT
ncbi:MAG: glycosyl hydrolase family 18 protein, partial [Acidimicrobiales bacterium]